MGEAICLLEESINQTVVTRIKRSTEFGWFSPWTLLCSMLKSSLSKKKSDHTRWCSLQNRTCLIFHFTITSKLQNADISPELWGWGTWRHILSIGFGMFSDLSYNWYNMKIGYDFVVLVVLDPASLLKSLACSQENNMRQGSRAFGASSGRVWMDLMNCWSINPHQHPIRCWSSVVWFGWHFTWDAEP